MHTAAAVQWDRFSGGERERKRGEMAGKGFLYVALSADRQTDGRQVQSREMQSAGILFE